MGGNFNNEQIERFIDQMISDRGVELSDEERFVERDRIIKELEKIINEAMVDALPEEKADMLEKLIDEKGDEVTENEVTAVIYNVENEMRDAAKKALDEFRERYLKGEI